MTSYRVTLRTSPLRGRTVVRKKGWPMGATGPAPDVPRVEGQAKRGPRNALVRYGRATWIVLPWSRAVRKAACKEERRG